MATKKKVIQAGDYVRHAHSREVYRVLSVCGLQAALLDAEDRHYGTYPFNELTVVSSTQVKIVKKYEVD